MKICPSCRETYTDDDLNFCLKDGSFLTTAEGGSEPKTVYMDSTRATNPNWTQPPPTGEPPVVWQNQSSIHHQPQGHFPLRIHSRDQTLPTISLILGILGFLTVCCYGGIPLGAGAIITGVIALGQEKNNPSRYAGRGLAIGGIITGAVGLLIGIGIIILAIIAG